MLCGVCSMTEIQQRRPRLMLRVQEEEKRYARITSGADIIKKNCVALLELKLSLLFVMENVPIIFTILLCTAIFLLKQS